MINIGENNIDQNSIKRKVCDFLNMEPIQMETTSIVAFIKEFVSKKLCEVVGLTGNFNHRTPFFDFFSSIMGEAVCEVLNIKIRIACDELRLVKYSGINLIDKAVEYLNTQSIDEAFLDTFEMVDKFKFLVEKIKFE